MARIFPFPSGGSTNDRSPPPDRVLHAVPLDTGAPPSASEDGGLVSNRVFSVIEAAIVVLAIYVFSQALISAGPRFFALSVAARTVLWGLLLLTAIAQTMRRGLSDLLTPVAPYVPFFGIGVVSMIVSVEPGEGVRELIFWLLGAVGAGAAGRQLGERLTARILFFIFAAALAASVVVALALPKVGLDVDERLAHGAWRGIFIQKNGLGWFSLYLLVLALMTPGLRVVVRLVAVGLAMICVIKAGSANAVLASVAVMGFLGLITAVRRARMSPSVQVMTVVAAGTFAAFALSVMWVPLLAVLGRNATLTGRTSVWALYLERAWDHWFIGAGPGSFSGWTAATGDIGLRLSGSGVGKLGLIATPHNFFIATFGEVGALGLIARLLPDLIFLFVLPFVRKGRGTLLLAGIVLTSLLTGLADTHNVFGPSIVTFLTVLIFASLGREEGKTGLSPATLTPRQGEPLRPELGPVVLG